MHCDAVRYQTTAGLVRFTVPTVDELEATASHALELGLIDDDLDGSDDELCDPCLACDLVVHRIWWLSSTNCTEPEHCRCGRISLVELLDLTDDPTVRNEMMTMHMTEMVSAYAHYWAGDAAARDSTRLLESVCADCLIHGEAHIEVVGGEANALAEEMGEALAVYQFSLGLGERRLPHPG